LPRQRDPAGPPSSSLYVFARRRHVPPVYYPPAGGDAVEPEILALGRARGVAGGGWGPVGRAQLFYRAD